MISSKNLWRRINERLYVSYSGIGGNVEPGESFEEAALRECEEEAGCKAEILPSPKTFVIDEVQGSLKRVDGTRGNPVMIVRKRVRGRKTLMFPAFLAEIRGVPKPCSEIPALLYALPQELFRNRAVSIREVVKDGSNLIENAKVPRSVLHRPWGTPYYLRTMAAKGLVDLHNLVEP